VTTSLRLRAELRGYLADLAERSRRSVSDVAQQLLEEAIRTRECPGIYFADEPGGRAAKIMGTGLGVWEVIRDYLGIGEREFALAPIVRSAELGETREDALHRLDVLTAELGLDRERARWWTIGQTLAWSTDTSLYPGHIEVVRWLMEEAE